MSFDSNGCLTVRKELYCKPSHGQPGNLTLLWPGGVPIAKDNCTLDTCSLKLSNWGYLPSIPASILFAVLFALLFAAHIPLGVWKKTWGIMVGMLLGCGLEVAGYVGRYMANKQPFSLNPFLLYIIFLTIAPAFLSAAIYMCLSRIMIVYGKDNARFSPRIYSMIFMFSDFVALVLQGAGGGFATVNSGKDADKAQRGINVMIAGLVWQVLSLTIYAVAAADFMWCVKKGRGAANPRFINLRNSKKFKLFLWSLSIQVLVIYIRSVYRVAELVQGFTGPIADIESLYTAMEPVMILIAVGLMTALHPSYVFGDQWAEADARKANDSSNHGKVMEMGGYVNTDYKPIVPEKNTGYAQANEYRPQDGYARGGRDQSAARQPLVGANYAPGSGDYQVNLPVQGQQYATPGFEPMRPTRNR